MRRGVPVLAALVAALALAPAGAAAEPPAAGLLVPGVSLGGLRLGMSRTDVEVRWGRAYGVCRSCRVTTWYFNLFAHQPEGAGVELRGGRVSAVFTLWAPRGWQTNRRVRIGDSAARVSQVYGEQLTRRRCGSYDALLLARGGTRTAFYVLDGEVWAFGLLDGRAAVCR